MLLYWDRERVERETGRVRGEDMQEGAGLESNPGPRGGQKLGEWRKEVRGREVRGPAGGQR